MSLIHEALKKAEAQRRLGQAPTLDSPDFRRARGRRWSWALPAAVVIAAAVWWWLRATPPPPPDSAAPVAATTAAEPAAALRAENSAKSDASIAPAAANPSPPPIKRSAPANAAQHSAPPQNKQPATRKAAPVVASPAKPVAAEKPNADQQNSHWVAAPAPSSGSQPNKSPAGARKSAPPTTPASATAQHAASNTARTGRSNSTSKLPMYWELPLDQRKDLPPLKISMHVYAANPADRFVILDGVRQVQGDKLADDLVLKRIAQDGIVIEHEGKLFMVPNNAGGY